MRSKTKEVYFILAVLVIFMLGFIIGSYFAIDVCQKHSSFREEYIEKCYFEKGIYEDICGHLEYIQDDMEKQECINRCFD